MRCVGSGPQVLLRDGGEAAAWLAQALGEGDEAAEFVVHWGDEGTP